MTPASPLILLLIAAMIWPKNPSIPLVDYCSVNSDTTPFWNDDISAQGDMDRWESKFITIFLIG